MKFVFTLLILFVLAPAQGESLSAPTDPATTGHSRTRQATIYDPDPKHLWNRLFAVFYCRANVEYQPDTIQRTKPEFRPTQMGPDVLDPPLGIHPRFLLDEAPFTECNSVLEEFLANHGEQLVPEPLKRAVMQRDLWSVFDLVQTEKEDYKRNYGDTPKQYTTGQQERRRILSQKIATVIQRLKLSRKEIEALPNTYVAAIKSGGFSVKIVDQSKGNYLPSDVFARDSRWVEVVPDRQFSHTQIVRGRSVFRVFLKSPNDREGSKAFTEWSEEVQRGIDARRQDKEGFYRIGGGYKQWEQALEKVPVGTQFLLLREMICLDEQWNLVPTHVVESVQLRVYLTRTPESGKLTQLFEEFDLDRSLLFGKKQGGLKATSAGEPRVFGYMALGRLAVNENGHILPLSPFPENCFTCHVQKNGVPSVQSLMRPSKISRPDPTAAIEKAIRWKKEQKDFQSLLRLVEASEPARAPR